jgi:hypothetical protein
VSHRPERKEKDCLNCGTTVHGKYCHFCGQENAVPKETFWQLVTHFVYDLTHFDGNFFSTIKHLLFKPGFLSSEYIKGRRAKYLNPIRMYIFTSAFFFLFFFSMVKPDDAIIITGKNLTYQKVKEAIDAKQNKLQEYLQDANTTEAFRNIIIDQIALLKNDEERLKNDTTNLLQLNYYKLDVVDLSPKKYNSVKQYDSLQAILPTAEKDGWLQRKAFIQKMLLTNKYGGDMKLIFINLLDKFLHSFPQILFLSLPLLALLLQMLYIRKKNKYYYVDHVIFSVHLYCAMFIFIFLLMCFSRLEHVPYIGWISWVQVPVLIYSFWYIYKSIRKFYLQSRLKTIFKYVLLLFFSTILMSFLFGVFFIFSAFAI